MKIIKRAAVGVGVYFAIGFALVCQAIALWLQSLWNGALILLWTLPLIVLYVLGGIVVRLVSR